MHFNMMPAAMRKSAFSLCLNFNLTLFLRHKWQVRPDKGIMNSFSGMPQLMSPQQLMALRASPLPAWPASPPPAPPASNPGFNRISSMLTPDQLQMYNQPSAAQQRILSNPISLFANLAPAVPIPRPAANVQLRPPQPAAPAVDLDALRMQSSIQRLKTLSPAELKELGESDKKAFFEALLPAALESEREFGVPAELTLAQAALESGWGRSPIGGYNIFGIKGTGPAGKTSVDTKEFLNGKWVNVRDGFAKYNNFYEAVQRHGKLFHNGYYDKAVNQFARDRSLHAFIDNIQGIYATDPNYSDKIRSIIRNHGIEEMAARAR